MFYQRKDPYVESIIRQATSIDTFTATFPKVDSCDYILVRSLSVANDTTTQSLIHVGIKYNNLALWIETLAITTAGTFYKMKGSLIVPKDYQIVIKVEDHADGDKVYANATGEYIAYDK